MLQRDVRWGGAPVYDKIEDERAETVSTRSESEVHKLGGASRQRFSP